MRWLGFVPALMVFVVACAVPAPTSDWEAREVQKDSVEKAEEYNKLLRRLHEVTLSDGTKCVVVWRDWEGYSSISCNWQTPEEESYF